MTFLTPHYWKNSSSKIKLLKKDMYMVKTPWWLKKIYPNCVWDMPGSANTIYLTFDDGPHPAITVRVLDTLKNFNAKATFFCIGSNVEKYPQVYRQLLDAGHATGNHTYSHLNGWQTDTAAYMEDIARAKKHIQSALFRPPYGRVKRTQLAQLQSGPLPLKTIMWDVLSGDWDTKLTKEKCLQHTIANVKSGSIVVFHDSEKAAERMLFVLPKLLQHFASKGYRFEAISEIEGKKIGLG